MTMMNRRSFVAGLLSGLALPFLSWARPAKKLAGVLKTEIGKNTNSITLYATDPHFTEHTVEATSGFNALCYVPAFGDKFPGWDVIGKGEAPVAIAHFVRQITHNQYLVHITYEFETEGTEDYHAGRLS
jgi:hypothetical protein